ncbi:MAG: hypothetical protein FJZ04_00335 [Candidatus Moranbacteria bacterium]|nr:hypothetical protein [Candidatus Moranbacteria bacterium]
MSFENEELLANRVREKELKTLNRGVWAEELRNGQELPLGGSLFSSELTTKLELDFESFNDRLENFNEENIRSLFQKNKKAFLDWLEEVGAQIDPYLFYVCCQVQNKTHKLLAVDPKNNVSSFERREVYNKNKNKPKLSSLIGKTECGERAALGQYLLQKVGLESIYVGGVSMDDAKDSNEYPTPHSFVVIKNRENPQETIIFDIARPKSQHNLPRLLKPDVPFNYELLKDKEEVLVGATEVLQGRRLYFGVGEQVAGEHNIIGKG